MWRDVILQNSFLYAYAVFAVDRTLLNKRGGCKETGTNGYCCLNFA
jgi:hypothetical protein